MRRGLLILGLLLPLAGLGCATGPQPLGAGNEGPIYSFLAPRAPWEARGDRPDWNHPGTRAVLAEFGLELVEEKWLLPGLAWNPLLYTPFPSMLGVSVHEAEWPPGLPEQLVVLLREWFADELLDRELSLVPLPDPVRALQGLRGVEREERELLPLADGPLKDSGLTRRVTAIGAPGQLLHPGERDPLRPADRALLEEAGADVVLRVSLRVGVLDDRAVLEAGSWIEWTSRARAGRLEAVRSLQGDRPVVSESGFMPLRGFEAVVAAGPFLAEARALLPRYVAFAVQAAR